MRSSVLFWYFRISLSATVPGLKRCGFFTPPVAGADLRAAFVASCFLGAFPPVDFLAVCFVRAISNRDCFTLEEEDEWYELKWWGWKYCVLREWDGVYLYKVEMEKKGWAGIFEMLFWFAKFWFSLGNRTVNAVWESTDAVFPRLKLRIAIRDTHKDTSRNKPRHAWYLLRFFIIIILGFNFFVSFFRV